MVKRILIVLLLLFAGTVLFARTVAVIPVLDGDPTHDSITKESCEKVIFSFERIGIFEIMPERIVNQTLANAQYDINVDSDLDRLAKDLNADRIVFVSTTQIGALSSGALMDYTPGTARAVRRFQGMIVLAIPLYLEREALELQRQNRLEIVLLKKENAEYIANAGEYHGLKEGDTLSIAGGGSLYIKKCTRLTSLVEKNALGEGPFIVTKTHPIQKYIDEINYEIRKTIYARKSSEVTMPVSAQAPEKRFLESLLIVNSGGNILLPGYGAYLSTYYMGFTDSVPHGAGIAMGCGIEAFQLCAIPFMTHFKANFFPFIDEKDRTHKEWRLQSYLWATIPLTFSATFCDQLSYNYERKKILPPGFLNADGSALFVSAIVPGGGFFYKGYRWTGWGFYSAELALGGYAVYHYGERKSKIALYSLAGVKAFEMALSYFVPEAYRFFRDDMAGVKVGITLLPVNKNSYAAAGFVSTSW